MTAQIELSNRETVCKLIFEAKDGILSDAEAKTLEDYLTFSVKFYSGTIHGKLCCAWGLIPPTLLSDHAYLWLFSTDAVEEYKFIFVRHSQRAIKEMLTEYPTIFGYCEVSKPRSIRWLKWLGAEFGEPTKTFLPFRIARKEALGG